MQRKFALIGLLVTVLSIGLFVSPRAGAEMNASGEEKSSQTAAPATTASAAPRKTAAILIFDDVQIIDYTGPYEVFGGVGIKVFTVATSTAPITTSMGMKVMPHYALDDAPAADVLLIPGGGVSAMVNDQRVLQWIRDRSQQAEYVMSVCNGAFILAKTGLLDGLTATTTAALIDGLPRVAPKVKVVRDQRYVDNGKFITTAGLSSGIDGALHVVEKMFGKGRAQITALDIEYDWKGDSTYARANFADRHILKALGRRFVPIEKLLGTEGTAHNWEMRWQGQTDASATEVLKQVNDKLSAAGWVAQKAKSETQSVWKFNDGDGGQWSGVAEAAGNKPVTVSLKIERTDASLRNMQARPARQRKSY